MGDPTAATPDVTPVTAYPDWLDRRRYPFDSFRIDLPEGRLHFIDEGGGRPLLLLHGNPTWSYLYRRFVRGLSDEYRCIAPDLLGFGLSETPSDFSYRPAAHARTLRRFVEALDLTDAVVVGHDWGGPLGADVTARYPDRVAGLVPMNTWLWPREDLVPQVSSRLAASALGERLFLRYNLFARTALGLPARLHGAFDAADYRQYVAPLATPADRVGTRTFVRELLASREWLERLWARRAVVADRPALLCWGQRDPIHGPFLRRWEALFPDAPVVARGDVGHFVPDEGGPALIRHVEQFLRGLP